MKKAPTVEPKNESEFITMTKERFDHCRTTVEDADTIAFMTREFKGLFNCFDKNMGKAEGRNLKFECDISKEVGNLPRETKDKIVKSVESELQKAGWNVNGERDIDVSLCTYKNISMVFKKGNFW